MTEVRRRPSMRRPNEGGVVMSVRPGSLADELGVLPGDRLTRIAGRELRDSVDVQFYAAEEQIELTLVRGDDERLLRADKHPDEDLGLEFQDAAFDGVRTCNNSCFFCFLKGNPKGMRNTLYVKDDDYRLSFVHGNFVTLTNLTEDDWRRLEEQRLSPLNVSVHATEPALRRYLLGNASAPDICEQLRRLGSMGIEANTQVVLCPGVNDGPPLDRTITDLAALYPTVRTISVVPVGATDVAEGRIGRGAHADEVAGCTPEHAAALMAQVKPYQRQFRAQHGRTLLYLADEYYLLAGCMPPSASRYDGFEQYENGIGMARSLIEDWRRARRRVMPAEPGAPRRATLVCATLIAPTLRALAAELAGALGIEINVVALQNDFFGPRVNVSGLLVGRGIARTLAGRDLGDIVLLPRYALDYSGTRFLDDVTPAQLQAELGVPIAFATSLSEALTILRHPVQSPVRGAGEPGATTNGKSWVDYREARGGVTADGVPN